MSLPPSAPFNPLPSRPPLRRLHHLLRHWHVLRADRTLPQPADFDILDIPQLFGHLHVVEVYEGAPTRFRFRLFGTRIADLGGRDLTGRWVSDIPPPIWAAAVHTAFEQPLAVRMPCYSRSDESHDTRVVEMHRLACPFSNDGNNIDRLLVGIEPAPRPLTTMVTAD
jgi:hypothetical protein